MYHWMAAAVSFAYFKRNTYKLHQNAYTTKCSLWATFGGKRFKTMDLTAYWTNGNVSESNINIFAMCLCFVIRLIIFQCELKKSCLIYATKSKHHNPFSPCRIC